MFGNLASFLEDCVINLWLNWFQLEQFYLDFWEFVWVSNILCHEVIEDELQIRKMRSIVPSET